MDKLKYRISSPQKSEIAFNIVKRMNSDEKLNKQSVSFIKNWIKTGHDEKTKAYYDVWDIVLKNYMPQTRPILFRSCSRRQNGKIASFTGRIGCAEKFNDNRNEFLIICDTNEYLQFWDKSERQGEYCHTFFPLSELIRKELSEDSPNFTEDLYKPYLGEDEYIMRVDLNWMQSCKWYKE